MIESILREIRIHRSFLITTHENPDGDAVGSSLALAGYLKRLGKDVTVHFCDPVPELYRFLPLADSVRQDLPDQDFDVCFVLDVGEFRRAGKLVNECRRIGMFINIDHHLTCDRFGTINYIDSAAAASGGTGLPPYQGRRSRHRLRYGPGTLYFHNHRYRFFPLLERKSRSLRHCG